MPEKVEEPQEERDAQERRAEQAAERAPAKPVGPVGPNVLFNRGIRIFAVLVAICLAAIVYYLPLDFLMKPVGGVRIGTHALRIALFPALLVLGAAFFILFKTFGSHLDYLKPTQGTWVRVTGYGLMGFLAAFAGFSLNSALVKSVSNNELVRALWSTQFLGINVRLTPLLFIASTVAGSLFLAYHFFMNRLKWVDFLIETQSELRRVSWPPTREWTGSATVVIIVIAFVSIFLFLVDEGLSKLLQKLKIGI